MAKLDLLATIWQKRYLPWNLRSTRDQELKVLLDVNAAVARHLERDELFGALASCLRKIIETDRFGIELPIEGNQLQGHLLTPRGAAGERTRPSVLPAPGTACDWVMRNHHSYICSTREELRERFPATFEVMQSQGMESLCALSLETDARSVGALFFMAARQGAYANLRRGLFEQIAGAVAVALDTCLAHEEVRRLRDRFAAENVYLQEEIRREHNFEEMIGNSPALMEVLHKIDMVAPDGFDSVANGRNRHGQGTRGAGDSQSQRTQGSVAGQG